MRSATSFARRVLLCVVCSAVVGSWACRPALSPQADSEGSAEATPEPSGRTARTSVPSSGLIGTRWKAYALEAEPAEWIFGPTLVTAVFHDHTSMTQIADWSGTDPRCLGVPDCVLLLDAEGVAFPLWFAHEGNQLVRIECIDWERTGQGTPPSDEALAQNSNFFVKYRRPDVFCGHGQTSPLYMPLDERSLLVRFPDVPIEPQELPNGGLIVPTGASSRYTGVADPTQPTNAPPPPQVPPPLPPNAIPSGSGAAEADGGVPTPPAPPQVVPGGVPVVLPPPPGAAGDAGIPPAPDFDRSGTAPPPPEPTAPRPTPPR